MVGRLTLAQVIGVRIPVPQPSKKQQRNSAVFLCAGGGELIEFLGYGILYFVYGSIFKFPGRIEIDTLRQQCRVPECGGAGYFCYIRQTKK